MVRIHPIRIGSLPPDQRISGESGSSVASNKKKKTGKKSAARVKEAAKKDADKAKNRAKKDAAKTKKQAKKAADKAKSLAKKAKKKAGKAKVAAKRAGKNHGTTAKVLVAPAPQSPSPASTAPSMSNTVAELRARAGELGIPGYSRLTKAQLVERITAGR